MCSVSCHEEGQPGWSIHQFISPDKGVKERCISRLITIRSDLSDHIHAREQFSQLDQQHYPHLLSTESNNFQTRTKGDHVHLSDNASFAFPLIAPRVQIVSEMSDFLNEVIMLFLIRKWNDFAFADSQWQTESIAKETYIISPSRNMR